MRFVFRIGSYGRPEHAQSLSNAKLAEDGVENLFHIHDANDFADCAQRLIKINRNVLPG
jgi:hypothetical protein